MEGKEINRCRFQVRGPANKGRANKLRRIKSAVKVLCKRAFIIQAHTAMQVYYLYMEVWFIYVVFQKLYITFFPFRFFFLVFSFSSFTNLQFFSRHLLIFDNEI